MRGPDSLGGRRQPGPAQGFTPSSDRRKVSLIIRRDNAIIEGIMQAIMIRRLQSRYCRCQWEAAAGTCR